MSDPWGASVGGKMSPQPDRGTGTAPIQRMGGGPALPGGFKGTLDEYNQQNFNKTGMSAEQVKNTMTGRGWVIGARMQAAQKAGVTWQGSQAQRSSASFLPGDKGFQQARDIPTLGAPMAGGPATRTPSGTGGKALPRPIGETAVGQAAKGKAWAGPAVQPQANVAPARPIGQMANEAVNGKPKQQNRPIGETANKLAAQGKPYLNNAKPSVNDRIGGRQLQQNQAAKAQRNTGQRPIGEKANAAARAAKAAPPMSPQQKTARQNLHAARDKAW